MTNNFSDYLILGASGSIGSAVVKELLCREIPVTILARNRKKVLRLFGENRNLEIVDGDVKDADLLKRTAEGKRFILHGINYPYPEWEENMEPVTRNVLDAASISGARILFPGNIYNFGNIKQSIFEDTPPKPCSHKGRLRVKLEEILANAAAGGKCSVTILRLPDFFGPNVMNDLVAPIFRNALAGKAMPWPVNAELPHQFVYIVDAGEIFVRLANENLDAQMEVYNFAGYTVTSVRSWIEQIGKAAGRKSKVKVYSKGLLRLLGIFVSVVSELDEMFYLYENSVLLNDDKLRKHFPGFSPTPMDQSVKETLDWFRHNEFQ